MMGDAYTNQLRDICGARLLEYLSYILVYNTLVFDGNRHVLGHIASRVKIALPVNMFG